MNQMQQRARRVERDVLGGLLGTLFGVLIVRLVLFAFELSLLPLFVLLIIGAWSGVFVAHVGMRSPENAVDSLKEWSARLRGGFLKTMLWLLGIAAVLGVVGVLTASFGYIDRVTATIVATAVAAGLLWPTSIMVDRDSSRAAGLLGMASVIVVFALATPLIWDLGKQSDEVGLTALIIGLLAPPGMVFLMMIPQPRTRIAGRVGVALYVLTLLLFLIAAWHPGDWRTTGNWWETGWAVVCMTPLALVSLGGVATDGQRIWRWAGVAASALACIQLVFHAWQGEPAVPWLLTLLVSTAVVFAHANACAFVPLKPHQRWLRTATIAALVITALCVNWQVAFVKNAAREFTMVVRLAGAAGIVASCGTLAMIVLARLNRTVDPIGSELPLSQCTLYCPRCGQKQVIAVGGARCSKCELSIVMQLGRD